MILREIFIREHAFNKKYAEGKRPNHPDRNEKIIERISDT
jgi:hypothetical protein